MLDYLTPLHSAKLEQKTEVSQCSQMISVVPRWRWLPNDGKICVSGRKSQHIWIIFIQRWSTFEWLYEIKIFFKLSDYQIVNTTYKFSQIAQDLTIYVGLLQLFKSTKYVCLNCLMIKFQFSCHKCWRTQEDGARRVIRGDHPQSRAGPAAGRESCCIFNWSATRTPFRIYRVFIGTPCIFIISCSTHWSPSIALLSRLSAVSNPDILRPRLVLKELNPICQFRIS